MKVTLREKKLKHGRRGLYLDFYPPIIHPNTQKQTRREHLRLYIYKRPKTTNDRKPKAKESIIKKQRCSAKIFGRNINWNYRWGFMALFPRGVNEMIGDWRKFLSYFD